MKRNKKILAVIIVLGVLLISTVVASIILWYLKVLLTTPLAITLDFVLILIIFGFLAYSLAVYVDRIRQFKEATKENEYNLHRKTAFYSYNYFSRVVTELLNRHKNKTGYFIVFNAVKTNAITMYTINKTADFNGFICDYIVSKYNDQNKDISNIHYCFYRNNFIFYLICDETKLNNFLNDLENEAYRLVSENEFRLNVQPTFGIYEHEPGDETSIYQMTNNAIAAREVAEKNFESALFFSEEMLKDSSSDEADEIARALENNEFVVYYQPKFSLGIRKFTSSEALIRWKKGPNEILSPMLFIDTAEHGGLIHKIDMYVFEQVCKDLDETRRKGRTQIPVSINFSLYEFYSPNFVEDITKILEKYNVNPSLLEIEIIEGTTTANLFLSISILKKLKQLGLRILMDDFGVGFSNFNNLKLLPIDVIKIDKSFINNIVDDVKSREIVKFMIEFSKEIGLEVVAEGVDNQKQVDILKKFKCDTIQGFYYSEPLPRNEFEKFIATNKFEKKENS